MGFDRLGKPYPVFEPEGLVGERAHRTYVDHVAGKLIVHRFGYVGGDLGGIATAQNTVHALRRKLVGHHNATVAQDTARHMQLYLITDINLVKCAPFELVAGLGQAVLIAQVLQVALTGLITYGAIQWVVDQQHLHDALACVQHLRRGNVLHFHAVHHRSAARSYQLRHGAWVLFRPFAHFDQTGTALPATTFQLGIVAHRRRDDVATDRAGRIQYGGPRCNFHRNTVNAYLEFNVFSHSFSAIRCQPSAASPVNFVLNYF